VFAVILISLLPDNGEAVSLNTFSASIKGIPSASPHLHTRLNFEYFGGDLFNTRKMQNAPNSIFAVINKLRLPCLRIVSIEIQPIELQVPADFRPFLLAHPKLHDVSINFHGQLLQDAALPNLRSFEGSAIDCVICNGRRRIESSCSNLNLTLASAAKRNKVVLVLGATSMFGMKILSCSAWPQLQRSDNYISPSEHHT